MDILPDEVGVQLRTVKEAQAFLRCGKTTIYELFKTGKLVRVKFGRCVRITQQSLNEIAKLQTDENLRLMLTQARPQWQGQIWIYDDNVTIRGVASIQGVGRASSLPVKEKVRIILDAIDQHVPEPA